MEKQDGSGWLCDRGKSGSHVFIEFILSWKDLGRFLKIYLWKLEMSLELKFSRLLWNEQRFEHILTENIDSIWKKNIVGDFGKDWIGSFLLWRGLILKIILLAERDRSAVLV